MSSVGTAERLTQNRIMALFRNELHHRSLGDWSDRDGNSNIDESLLTNWLIGRGYSNQLISAALSMRRATSISSGAPRQRSMPFDLEILGESD
jgi:type I restriction enzyme R subunit